MLTLALAGCHDPYQAKSPTQRAASTPGATAPGETDRPGSSPAQLYRPEARRSGARAAAAAFARRWANWDWRTAPGQQRSLARLATGRLAAQLRLGARATAKDGSLARDKPSARGDVVAIDLKPAGEHAAGVVVTREQTYTDGHADLGGAHYRVYLTSLTRTPTGWAITRWEPQP